MPDNTKGLISNGSNGGIGSIPGYIENKAGDIKTWLFGGDATKGMADGPASAQYQIDYLKQMLAQAAPQLDPSQQAQARAGQQQVAGRLDLVAQGHQPGAGEMAVNRQIGQAQAAQYAQAAAARGANSALASREAARNIANVGVAGAGQAAQAQTVDQANANAALAGLYGTQRSQDINFAQGNTNADLQQQQLRINALAQMLGVDEATLKQDIAKRAIAAGDKGMLPDLLQYMGNNVAAGASIAGAK